MGRSPCCEKEHTNKGAWTKEEDELLTKYIAKHGEGCWRSLPKAAGLQRCGKSCRLRWINYLRPDLKRGNFTEEEDEIIISLHSLLGNKWSLIAARLPGRTDNEIKNYWNTHIKRKLISRGIDPQTHKAIGSSSTSPRSSSNPPPPLPILQTFSMQKGVEDDLATENQLCFKVTTTGEELSNGSSVLSEELAAEIDLELSIRPPQTTRDRTMNLPEKNEVKHRIFGQFIDDPVAAKTLCSCGNVGFVEDSGSCNCLPHVKDESRFRFLRPLSL